MKIIDWLLSSHSTDRYDLYVPRERLLYGYWAGEYCWHLGMFRSKKITWVDPIDLYKRIMASGPELAIDVAVATSPSKDAMKAYGNVIAKIREVFGVKAQSDGGLTETETANLLEHFFLYCDRIKKNSNPSANNWDQTNSPPQPPSSGVGQPTGNTSASGSTASDHSTSTPEPSPSELQSA